MTGRRMNSSVKFMPAGSRPGLGRTEPYSTRRALMSSGYKDIKTKDIRTYVSFDMARKG